MWVAEEGVVAWTDLLVPRLFRFREKAPAWDVVAAHEPVMCLVRAPGGAFVQATADAIWVGPLGRPERIRARLAAPGTRFNDGAADASGLLWIGAKSIDGTAGVGALYRSDGSTLTVVLRGMMTPNGLGWSPDGRTMYVTDSGVGTIHAFEFDPGSGTIAGRRPFVVVDPADGRPDGLAIDVDGGVWSALWGGGRVVRYEPTDGSVSGVIDVPVPFVTSCAFGGQDLDRLYIVTARMGSDAHGAGGLFAIDPGVSGLPRGRSA